MADMKCGNRRLLARIYVTMLYQLLRSCCVELSVNDDGGGVDLYHDAISVAEFMLRWLM